MGNVTVKVNYRGVGELLNSDWAAKCCQEVAARAASRAGEGYAAAEPHKTGQRVAVNIYPATKEAAGDNYKNNTLLKAVGGRC